MNHKRTVPVAYVTKWAVTRGILVVKNATTAGDDGEYLRNSRLFAGPTQWTEDREVASGRWRKAMEKARVAAARKAAKLADRFVQPPPFTEEP
jgi:hypothetical protein